MATPASPTTPTDKTDAKHTVNTTGATNDAQQGGLFIGDEATYNSITPAIAADLAAANTSANDASSSASAAAGSAASASASATAASGSQASANASQQAAETAKDDAETAETNAQTAESNASDHRTDAGKYAVNPHDTAFTLTSTNGGTSGLYSALHYNVEAGYSASDAEKLAINAEDSQFTLSDGVTTGYSALHYKEKADDANTSATNHAIEPTTNFATGSAKAWALGGGASFSPTTPITGSGATALYSAQYYRDQAEIFGGHYKSGTSDPWIAIGDSKVAGDIWYNTSTDDLYIWDGSAWQLFVSYGDVVLQDNTYVATSGQTTFTGADANGSTLSVITGAQMYVYINGILLQSSDFTSSDSSNNVVLSVAANLSDDVRIIQYHPFDNVHYNTLIDKAADAEKLATNAEDSQFTLSDGTTTGYSALHHKEKALDAQTAAETAQTAAETAETNAETSETNANLSKINAATSATNAATSATKSENYAVKIDGNISGTSDYSSKAWAIGGTGISNQLNAGAAKEWATTTGSAVDTSEYSAKEYAIGTTVPEGSAKDWAITAEDTTVDGTEYSAKHYAAKAEASAGTAADPWTVTVNDLSYSSGNVSIVGSSRRLRLEDGAHIILENSAGSNAGSIYGKTDVAADTILLEGDNAYTPGTAGNIDNPADVAIKRDLSIHQEDGYRRGRVNHLANNEGMGLQAYSSTGAGTLDLSQPALIKLPQDYVLHNQSFVSTTNVTSSDTTIVLPGESNSGSGGNAWYAFKLSDHDAPVKKTNNYHLILHLVVGGRFLEDSDDPGWRAYLQYYNNTTSTFTNVTATDVYHRARYADRGVDNYIHGSFSMTTKVGFTPDAIRYASSGHTYENYGLFRIQVSGHGGTAGDDLDVYFHSLSITECANYT